MSCSKCIDDTCICSRTEAINRFSKDYKAGFQDGRKGEAERTADALIELESKGIISNDQLQSILDLILEKLTDVMDID